MRMRSQFKQAPRQTSVMQIYRSPGSTDLAGVLERMLDKGIVVEPAITIAIAGLNAAEHSITITEGETDFLLAA